MRKVNFLPFSSPFWDKKRAWDLKSPFRSEHSDFSQSTHPILSSSAAKNLVRHDFSTGPCGRSWTIQLWQRHLLNQKGGTYTIENVYFCLYSVYFIYVYACIIWIDKIIWRYTTILLLKIVNAPSLVNFDSWSK